MTTLNCLRARRVGDVVVVTVRGQYTDHLHAEMVRLVTDEVDHEPVRALVIDMTEAEFPSKGAPPMRGGGPGRLPVALVVRPEILSAVFGVCAAMSAQGVQWVPFTAQAEALRWSQAREPYWHRFVPR